MQVEDIGSFHGYIVLDFGLLDSLNIAAEFQYDLAKDALLNYIHFLFLHIWLIMWYVSLYR